MFKSLSIVDAGYINSKKFLQSNVLVDVLIFVLVDVLRDFLLNSFFL